MLPLTRPDREAVMRNDADKQKRLMAESMGLPSDTYISKPINLLKQGDYGADPLGDGRFRMVPSGDVVDYEERCKRLTKE
jgi:hypothetical protein